MKYVVQRKNIPHSWYEIYNMESDEVIAEFKHGSDPEADVRVANDANSSH